MKLKLLVLILSLSFVACSIPKPRPDIYGIESGTALVALVLGEGIARSYAHVGVIKALEEEKIPIHMVVGSGMGGLMGALYANKKSANDLEWHAMNFKKDMYLDFKIQGFLNQRLVHSKLESLPVRLFLATTDLKTGSPTLLDKGPIIPAVQASLVIPGIVGPISIENKLLVSGEISQGLPVDIAKQRGADLIIAVDLTQGIDSYTFKRDRDITIQSYKISSASLTKKQLESAHVIIRPEVSKIDFLDFSRKREAMLAGYEAAKKVIPELKEILQLQEED
ncbi:MAG: hypothetical protein HYW85_02655 [Deltaproteobacteria bacterium]|nr:hypothetical protein [Deltaproteobacteria bacterium]MBI3016457.1 hypothetical protein [Deltaproteobacteria bacterium]